MTSRPLPTDAPDVAGDAASALRTCLNCGADLLGPFCANCGQRDIPAYPSTRELVIDAAHELSGWDGRIAATLRTLLFKPGRLTREFLAGRRKRYVSPLRLYLGASVAYFVLAAAAPTVKLESGKTLFVGVQVGVTKEAPNEQDPLAGLSAQDREEVLAELASAPPLLRPLIERTLQDPEGFRRGLLNAFPRTFFALLPIFAAIVAVFYRARKYPEHLYFSVHLHAFIFLAFAVIELIKFIGVPALVITISIIVLLTIPVYATSAFRTVYGGPMLRTLVKEVAIAAIYGAVAIAAMTLTILVVSATA